MATEASPSGDLSELPASNLRISSLAANCNFRIADHPPRTGDAALLRIARYTAKYIPLSALAFGGIAFWLHPAKAPEAQIVALKVPVGTPIQVALDRGTAGSPVPKALFLIFRIGQHSFVYSKGSAVFSVCKSPKLRLRLRSRAG